MAFLPPVLGCLVKKGLPRAPHGTPLATPMRCLKFRRPAPLYSICSSGWNCCGRCTGYLLGLPNVLSSLQSTPTAISSSSPSAASVLSRLSDLRVPEHSGISVGLLFRRLTRARLHRQEDSLFLRSLIRLLPFPPFFRFVLRQFWAQSLHYWPYLLVPHSSQPLPYLFPSQPFLEKRSVVINPGHAPIPRKLVMKITDGHFLDLADLLSANLRARGKRTTNVFGWLTCGIGSQTPRGWSVGHPHVDSSFLPLSSRPVTGPIALWLKLLIIQRARQYPGRAWLDYDLAFRKDAAALSLIDW